MVGSDPIERPDHTRSEVHTYADGDYPRQNRYAKLCSKNLAKQIANADSKSEDKHGDQQEENNKPNQAERCQNSSLTHCVI